MAQNRLKLGILGVQKIILEQYVKAKINNFVSFEKDLCFNFDFIEKFLKLCA